MKFLFVFLLVAILVTTIFCNNPVMAKTNTKKLLNEILALQQDNANITNSHIISLEQKTTLLSQQISLIQSMFQKILAIENQKVH